MVELQFHSMSKTEKDREKARILLIGDLNIPAKASGLPEKFKELLVPGKLTHVICTGNVGDNIHLNLLKSLSPNLYMVLGDADRVSHLF